MLLDNTGFQINPGERVGLVGRNGHGKTTMLKMLMGLEEPDTGNIQIPGDYRVGYLTQHIKFAKESVLKECMEGLMVHEQNHSWKAERILAGLGFSNEDMMRPPSDFSGGFQVRLSLAKVLVSEPDLLILDEPTNYLDITSIRWITDFLSSWPREILLVTHDRHFMDRVVTHIAGIHRQVIRKIKGDTEKYYIQIAQDEEIYEKTRLNEEKKRKDMETFITRFRAKARLAGMVQSRVKTLAKMDKKEGLQKMEFLEFSFRDQPFAGKQIMQVEDLSFGYEPSTPLIHDFCLTVAPEDRIAIVGKNGKGKTTLMKLLAGHLKALPMETDQNKVDQNKIDPNKIDKIKTDKVKTDKVKTDKVKAGQKIIRFNPGVELGYFEQTNVSSLNAMATVEEEILNSHADLDRQQARNICGAMMFQGDNALKQVRVLSGGEKSRVMLGKLLARPLNLLMLDEPTNHLDMEACDSLVAALDNFQGAVLLVTHNEMFLHSLANRLIVFKNNNIHVFEGSYQEFLEKEGWEEGTETLAQESNSAEVQDNGLETAKISKKEMRKLRSEIIALRSKEVGPLQKQSDKIENEIQGLEADLEELNGAIQEATEQMDGQAIGEISSNIGKCQSRIDELFEDLTQISEDLEEKNNYFEKKLSALER